jgi:hypothetical protein
MDEMTEPPKTHRAAKCQVSAFVLIIHDLTTLLPVHKALVRDNYSCLVTGEVDFDVAKNDAEVRQMANAEGRFAVQSQCAHILPGSITRNMSGTKEGSDKVCPFTPYEMYAW